MKMMELSLGEKWTRNEIGPNLAKSNFESIW